MLQKYSRDGVKGNYNDRDYMLQEYSRDGVKGNHNDRIDMFVLLDLIGTADTQFTKLEQSTGKFYE